MQMYRSGHDGTGGKKSIFKAGAFLGLVLGFAGLFSGSVRASDVLILTEDYPPYNHLDADGNVVGRSTVIVRQVMEASGLEYRIKLVPWNRAIKLTSSQKNVLIYSIIRTKAREDSFHWLVPLMDANLYLYGRADDTRTVDLWALRQGLFTAVCTLGDAACVQLREMGMPEKSVLAQAKTQEVEARLVASGRADLFIAQENLVRALGEQSDFYKGRFRKMMKLPGDSFFYLAAGSGLKAEIREAIDAAYQRLVSEGTLGAAPDRK